ncbi:CPBP family intramembrane glutamic endopeptidase [Rheinheimera sp. 4Y26]|uniref:CPBP family intramembrane glutamic endopeptidase n=1 Tax=Rheinheimera sp. 4Y26 TaxID=2977811 RepID=UPI0021B0C322|nr:CPBP family intramembrane glutamic endopeptidase [Rheinheimera sp. 4Y26]MCT6699502.1 CPBP family intramembrane metalloprotease [Rheinheimera sp. 4Y26]
MDLLQPQLLIWLLLAVAILLVFITGVQSQALASDRGPLQQQEPQPEPWHQAQQAFYCHWFAAFISQQRTRQLAWFSFAAALVAALLFERLAPLTFATLLFAFALLYWLKNGGQRWQQVARHSLVIVLSLLLSLHLLPGFENWLQLDHIQLSEQSRPFSLYLNLDKPIVFFLLLLLLPDLPGRYQLNFNASAQLLSISLLAIVALSLLAIALGFVALEWKLPHWWWLFALNNLLFTSVVEEAFFRGYLQRLCRQKTGPLVAIFLVALLFGLAHLAGGVWYAMLAGLAGLFYGYLYWRSGSLVVAVAGHFAVNLVHFLALTYPALG